MSEFDLQDSTLAAHIKAKRNVTVYLRNGLKLIGVLAGADRHVIKLNAPGHEDQMIYKHAISTIEVAK